MKMSSDTLTKQIDRKSSDSSDHADPDRLHSIWYQNNKNELLYKIFIGKLNAIVVLIYRSPTI
jgi:hypothetical protein